ncbi:methyltransferase [Candidatus Woesearchaeota archaeon]|nr:methyltransferase [Candidatus Woesearchaeota archaeon]
MAKSEAALLTLPGMEDIAAQEIEELLNKKGVVCSSFVLFPFEKKEDLFHITYFSQSARKVVEIFSFVKHHHESYEIIIKKMIVQLDQKKIKDIISQNATFNITCIKENYSSETSSPDIAAELAKPIADFTRAKAVYQNPQIPFILFITKEEAMFGLDIAGIDLSKRDYKIFIGAQSLKGPLAYALTRLAGFEEGKSILDPFCGSGTIPIEAAFHACHRSINFFRKKNLFFCKEDVALHLTETLDKKQKKEVKAKIWAIGDSFTHIASTKKNAKVAGVYDFLNYSRTEINYLDAKFEGDTFDCIVTQPPILSQRANENKLRRLYTQFFDEVAFLLKKKGKLVLLCKHPDHFLPEAERVKLPLHSQRQIWQGQEEFTILIFEK